MPASFAHLRFLPQLPPRSRTGIVIACSAIAVIAITFPSGVLARNTLAPQEIEAAQAAVARAEQADADQYAAEALLKARTALGQAQAALAAKKDDDAELLARMAAAQADYAQARSRQATQQAELASRRAEIADLQQKLGVEGAP